jgi:hypothetical protein
LRQLAALKSPSCSKILIIQTDIKVVKDHEVLHQGNVE